CLPTWAGRLSPRRTPRSRSRCPSADPPTMFRRGLRASEPRGSTALPGAVHLILKIPPLRLRAMHSNAFDAMVVPVIRGLFLTALLGGAAIGLARMVRAIASCLLTDGDEAMPFDMEGPTHMAPETGLIPAEEGFATAGAG